MSSHAINRVVVSLVLTFVGYSQASTAVAADSSITLDLAGYDASCGIDVAQSGSTIEITWPMGEQQGRFTLDLSEDQPLIQSIATASIDGSFQSIAERLDPVIFVRVGDRDLEKRAGWTVFFDRMQSKPSESHFATISPTRATASSQSQRVTLSLDGVSAGPFKGELRWTFYRGNPFVLQEAVVSTERPRTAFLYDMGMVFRDTIPERMTWTQAAGDITSATSEQFATSRNVAVQGRSVAAESDIGSIALFPPPHRYFYPLDYSTNLKNIWIGPNYRDSELPFGFGVRHESRGDNRYVPWFNAPPGTQQELGLFLLLSSDSANEALAQVAKLTRQDRFEPLPGHAVFSSHYHVEHTRELLRAQDKPSSDSRIGLLPSGDEYAIPPPLEDPGFARVFRDLGIDIVHLAEFHYGNTPRKKQKERLHHLELLHAECRRLSDDRLLLLPGEEPNVHLGGHWISFFPKPVYWVLNRPESKPFVFEHPKLGPVYHVGSEADVLRLLRAERGLAWTAHPRIKGSTGYPDRYRDRLFYQSDRFLGGAWKSMPADLSEPLLGSRVLNLLDDMSNWGDRKYTPGEVDVFQIEPDHELYGHMNVNYLRLDRVPRFEEGWQSLLDALSRGQFFVTTGEVLIPRFAVDEVESGATVVLSESNSATVSVDLQWTFPLAYAEMVMGDGQDIKRHRIDLTETNAYGQQSLEVDLDVSGQNWLRFEVWDIATNGAFTQPVWLQHKDWGQ